MIIGKYSVMPYDVIYGECDFNADVGQYCVSIYLSSPIGESVLSQWAIKKEETDALLKLIDKCVKMREAIWPDESAEWKEMGDGE